MLNGVKIDFKELRALQVVLAKFKSYRVRVGVLGGSKADRFNFLTSTSTVDKLNNPTLGLIHEFGSKSNNIPARSFLRVPLMTVLPKKIDQIGKAVWRSLILQKGPINALQNLGVLAENTVQQAFNVSGPGWAPLSAATQRRKGKKKNRILIDTGQLRRSITSAVVKQGP